MSAGTEIRNAAVYCGSSSKCDPRYLTEAALVGEMLADNAIHLVYGGGSSGLMGSVADAVLKAGGGVTGVIPGFMVDVEWAHEGLTDLRIVDSMHERKKLILGLSDAVIALPGGCGTLEELLEAITWKRLGLFTGPIVIVNQNGFYDACIEMLQICIRERFMNDHHGAIWRIADSAADVLGELESSGPWPRDAIKTAPVK